MPEDYGLREFVTFINDMTAVDALDRKLPAKWHHLLRRQGTLFSAAVAELIELLTKGYPDSVRVFRERKALAGVGFS